MFFILVGILDVAQFRCICNPPALIIGIYNADNYHILYSISESYRIKKPEIKYGLKVECQSFQNLRKMNYRHETIL